MEVFFNQLLLVCNISAPFFLIYTFLILFQEKSSLIDFNWKQYELVNKSIFLIAWIIAFIIKISG
jgi:hypothetical protein